MTRRTVIRSRGTTRPVSRLAALAALALALAGGACARPDAGTGLAAGQRIRRDLLGGVAGAVPLVCPTPQSQSASAVIGPDGGTLAIGNTRIDFPAGAVAAPDTFVLSVPAGQLMGIEAHAVGYDHYQFGAPVTVTVDLSRCGSGLPAGLHAWYSDLSTGALLEDMGGVTDTVAHTQTFQTPHFSGYLIAD